MKIEIGKIDVKYLFDYESSNHTECECDDNDYCKCSTIDDAYVSSPRYVYNGS